MRLEEANIRSFGHTIMLAGAIYQGEGKTYLAFFPEDQKDHNLASQLGRSAWPSTAQMELLEMSLTEWAEFLQQTDHLMTEAIRPGPDGAPMKAIVRKCERHIDNGVSWKVYRRDGFRCRYCGDDKVPLTVDHLVLWEDGGPSIEQNLVAACRNCNKARGRMQYYDWLRSDEYKQRSKNLPFGVKQNNEDLVETLDSIPRMVNVKSR